MRPPALAAAAIVAIAAVALAANPPLPGGGSYGGAPALSPTARPPAAAPPAAPPLASPPPAAAPGGPGAPLSFIRVQDGKFVDGDCNTWWPSGWNQWEAVEMGAGAPVLWGGSLPPGKTGPQLLREIFDEGAAAGFNVVRFLAHGVSKETALQTSPGQYSEAAFKGLDYALAEARARGLRVILALTSNWGDVGSVDEYVAWSPTASEHDQFYADAASRDAYLKHAAAITSRVNSITGVNYADDPTIFAWNLINEPRCYRCGGAIADWVRAVAPAVKKLAPKQLVTIGEEGFYGRGSARSAVNPGGGESWAGDEGQDFVADHAADGIDFASIHLWPDNWKQPDLAFAKAWLAAHATDAAAARKPLLLEEHGKWLKDGATEADRNAFYGSILDAVHASAAAGGPVVGSLFWSYLHPGQEAPRSEGGGRGLYGVRPGDAAFAAASSNARQMASLAAPLPGCTKALTGPPALARPGGACLDTRVRGLAGTGREGPACEADIDECVRGSHDCGPGTACVNTDGGFRCACAAGYVRRAAGGGGGGAGPACDPAPGLATIRDAYESDGPGRAQCGGGRLLPWPASAPGARPDPLGGPPRLEPYGRLSLADCLLACDAAPGCVVADHNPGAGRCRLRGEGGSRATCDAPEPDSTETDQSLEPMVFSNGALCTSNHEVGVGPLFDIARVRCGRRPAALPARRPQAQAPRPARLGWARRPARRQRHGRVRRRAGHGRGRARRRGGQLHRDDARLGVRGRVVRWQPDGVRGRHRQVRVPGRGRRRLRRGGRGHDGVPVPAVLVADGVDGRVAGRHRARHPGVGPVPVPGPQRHAPAGGRVVRHAADCGAHLRAGGGPAVGRRPRRPLARGVGLAVRNRGGRARRGRGGGQGRRPGGRRPAAGGLGRQGRPRGAAVRAGGLTVPATLCRFFKLQERGPGAGGAAARAT